jgi:glycosyltransferase involved in cell wall biosynthesis
MIEQLINNSIIVGEYTKNEKKKFDIKTDLKEENNNSWWYKSKNNKKRVMLCGTYPIGTSNGYSKVVYYICKEMEKYDDIELTIYGFQGINNTNGANIRNDISNKIKLHDAMATEDPRRNGFGEKEIGNYLKENPQDIIIIFNDNIVTTALTQTLVKECWDEKKNFKLISYMDQVYPYQKKNYITLLNTFFDGIITFTPYWENIAKKLGIKLKKIYYFPHGFDKNNYFPVDMKISRIYYNLPENDFLVLNLNRNQPRKRWDITIIAWAKFVEKHYNLNVLNNNENEITKRNIKLVIGTMINGYWDLMDIFENEINFTNVPWEYAKETIISIEKPQQLSDKEINILYNACDIGLNTADGEGFGLCGFEGAGLGKAQVSSYVGGMIEFLSEEYSLIIKPSVSIYLDCKSVGIGGKAELTSPSEYSEAFWKYFSNPELVKEHGKKSREHILTHYRWETLVEYFYKKILLDI